MKLCNSILGTLNLARSQARLHIRKGKGSSERYTAIPLPARKLCRLGWILASKWSSASSPVSHYLFVYVEIPGERLTVRAIQSMIAEAGKRAGIKEPVTPHVLRHTCAFMLRTKGADIETRAKMFGHSIETASRYGAPGMKEIEQAAALLDDAEAA